MYAVLDGEKIRAMRQDRGLSRRSFAKEAGVAPSRAASARISGGNPARGA
jgi:transcriptional regulator with XRE-family HTH domain